MNLFWYCPSSNWLLLFRVVYRYVDAMLDIMMQEPGVESIDGNPEYIFLGPDEHTAGYDMIAVIVHCHYHHLTSRLTMLQLHALQVHGCCV